jgi:hypothetical protein
VDDHGISVNTGYPHSPYRRALNKRLLMHKPRVPRQVRRGVAVRHARVLHAPGHRRLVGGLREPRAAHHGRHHALGGGGLQVGALTPTTMLNFSGPSCAATLNPTCSTLVGRWVVPRGHAIQSAFFTSDHSSSASLSQGPVSL